MTEERAVLAGGCFWGMQDLFRRYDGVISTRVGYSGGDVPNATYRNHGTHAEAIEIVFDPAKISYRRLLEFFFQIHDPTTRNRQGNDVGMSYRSAIFYTSDEQRRVAEDTIADVEASSKPSTMRHLQRAHIPGRHVPLPNGTMGSLSKQNLLSVFQVSTTVRAEPGLWFAEGVATFGLILAILGTLRWRADNVPMVVGLYITSAYWFTASTSFANPAVTLARSLTDTFAGIHPAGIPEFVLAQFAGHC